MAHVCSGVTPCSNWHDPEVVMAKYMVHGNWDPGIKNPKKEMLLDEPNAEGIYKVSAAEEAYNVSTLEAVSSGSPVLVSDADVQWFMHEVDGNYEVQRLTSKITKDMLDPGDFEASEIDDGGCTYIASVDRFGSSALLVLSWCALSVPLAGLVCILVRPYVGCHVRGT